MRERDGDGKGEGEGRTDVADDEDGRDEARRHPEEARGPRGRRDHVEDEAALNGGSVLVTWGLEMCWGRTNAM